MNSTTVPQGLWEWLAAIEGDERFVLVIATILFSLIATVLVMAIVVTAITRIHRVRLETALKHELLDRGLSPEEIVAVISASGGRRTEITPQQAG